MQVFSKDNLEVKVLQTRKEMGKIAAKDFADCVRRLLTEKETIRVVFAAAPSQNDFLESAAKDSGIDFEFRTTLIKEFHTADDVQKIAYLVSGAPRYFMQKYNDNDGCIAHGYTPVPKADAENYKEYFADKVNFVSLRGYK